MTTMIPMMKIVKMVTMMMIFDLVSAALAKKLTAGENSIDDDGDDDF